MREVVIAILIYLVSTIPFYFILGLINIKEENTAEERCDKTQCGSCPFPCGDHIKEVEEMKVYIVKRGDSLWSIAQKELGAGARYPEIKALNNLKGDSLQVGQALKIPSDTTETVSESHYEKLGKLTETALQDISELASVKNLLKELEG